MSFLDEPRSRVHVYRLPARLSDGYCFGAGKPITFMNVDWFDASIPAGKGELANFVKTKRYFDHRARFLVLADHPDLTFTIEPAGAAGEGGK